MNSIFEVDQEKQMQLKAKTVCSTSSACNNTYFAYTGNQWKNVRMKSTVMTYGM